MSRMIRVQYGRTPLHIAIISARRPESVPGMLARFKYPEHVSWYVAEGDVAAYVEAGAKVVVEAGALCRSRNMALGVAQRAGLHCVQLSDDLEWLKYSPTNSRSDWYDISLLRALRLMHDGLLFPGNAMLAGVAATNNPYFCRVDINRKGFCLGDMIMVHRANPLRFDERLRLKEDYDYTLQNLFRYGEVARMERILPSFSHRTNAGGAVAYRNEREEQRAIARLLERWPGCITPNAKRPNEVLMRWPPKKGSEMAQRVADAEVEIAG